MGVFIDSIDVTGLVIEDLFDTGINSVSEESSAGSLIVYERQRTYTEIDLVGGPDWGWLSLSVLRSLQALASVIGATYTLNYEGTEITVRFRTEDFPVIQAEKLIDRSNQADSDLYNNITIKLTGV